MKKQVFKRKKLGMALILTLMVSVVAVAIASSYIGMIGAHSKAARAYTKEALALSLARTGLNATVNAMGVPNNWGQSETNTFVNVFNIPEGDGIHILTDANNKIEATHTDDVTPVRAANDGELSWFAGNFLTADDEANNIGRYVTNPINLQDGLSGVLVIAVVPENVNFDPTTNLPRNNINYSVGVAALIFNTADVTGDGALDNFDQGCVTRLISSRVVKYRVSNVFPGSMYQNMAAADYPGTNHSEIGHFGYPNWDDFTADAAFMDENTQWDGGMSIDGALDSQGNTTWGASRTGNAFDDENITEYINGNPGVDTSGFLKISLLQNNVDIRANDTLLPRIAKTASAQKRLVYYDLANGNKQDFSDANNNLQGPLNRITNNNTPTINANSTNFRSIWNRVTGEGADQAEQSLLSAIDSHGQPIDGLYRQLKNNGNADITVGVAGNTDGYINYTAGDYQPDPMYGNETMEVPTVRITISQNEDGNDVYDIERIGYVPSGTAGRVRTIRDTQANVNDATNPSGWVETQMEHVQLNSDDINGMIYVGGANVQVCGRAARSVSIVSDVNSEVEAENFRVQNNIDGNNEHFNRNLNSPNVATNANRDSFRFIDASLNDDGSWGVNGSINAPDANSLISTVNAIGQYANDDNNNLRLNLNAGENYVFPTYGDDEQPSGNITVIGDLNTVEGTNPVVGLIAKNRVFLNDMSHTVANSTNPTWTDRDDAMSRIPANDADGDGILTVKAVVASETHNMCFDFNNVSKNLNYFRTDAETANGFMNNGGANVRNYAPGNTQNPGNGATGFANENTNYGMLLNNNLATRLGVNNNDNVVTDDGNGNATYFFNKYNNLLPNAQRMVWADTFIGAIRPAWRSVDGVQQIAPNFNPRLFSKGTLNFHGMIISRFGDINADAGVRDNDTGGRRDQLGYVNQFVNFDTNLQDNSAPYFSTSSQLFSVATGNINWNILSYVDKGSFNWQSNQNN